MQSHQNGIPTKMQPHQNGIPTKMEPQQNGAPTKCNPHQNGIPTKMESHHTLDVCFPWLQRGQPALCLGNCYRSNFSCCELHWKCLLWSGTSCDGPTDEWPTSKLKSVLPCNHLGKTPLFPQKSGELMSVLTSSVFWMSIKATNDINHFYVSMYINSVPIFSEKSGYKLLLNINIPLNKFITGEQRTYFSFLQKKGQ